MAGVFVTETLARNGALTRPTAILGEERPR